MSKFAFFVAFLLVGFQVTSAQNPVRSTPPSATSGPCFFQPTVGGGWSARVNYQYPPIFSQEMLASAPFAQAGQSAYIIASSLDYEREVPVFGCNTAVMMLTVFYYPAGTSTVFSIPLTGGTWTPSFVTGAPLVGSMATQFVSATAFASQGNRLVMLGNFRNSIGTSSRAYDVSGILSGAAPAELFDFGVGGLEASSVGNPCATAASVWFTLGLGAQLSQLFQVQGGTLSSVASSSAGFNLACSATAASFSLSVLGQEKTFSVKDGSAGLGINPNFQR